jgi:hypothetical protein
MRCADALRSELRTGLALVLLVAGTSIAGPADVVAAQARCSAASVCTCDVTVRHADEGWSHYADRWEVVAPDGRILGTRVLRHPHVGEQPFTRALAGVLVPASISKVTIRAHDSVHGFGGAEVTVRLERPSPHRDPE